MFIPMIKKPLSTALGFTTILALSGAMSVHAQTSTSSTGPTLQKDVQVAQSSGSSSGATGSAPSPSDSSPTSGRATGADTSSGASGTVGSGGTSASSSSDSAGSSGTSGASGSSATSGSNGASATNGSSGSGSSGGSGTGGSSESTTGSSGGTGPTGANSSSGTTGASGPASSSASGTISSADRKLMVEMAQANVNEIAVAQVAQSKAQSEQVKAFAQRMVDDHTSALNELQQLAQAKGLQLPSEPDGKHQAALKKMEKLSGAAFDKQYIAQAGVADHRNTNKLLQRVSSRAQDAELKALAAKQEHTVQQHLDMAQETRSGAAKSGSSGASGSSGTSDSKASGQ